MRCSPSQEKRRIIRIRRLKVAGPPAQPSSSSTSPPPSLWWRSYCIHMGGCRGPEMPGIQSHAPPLPNHSNPIPKSLFSSQHQKDHTTTLRPKPSLQYLGLLLRDILLQWVFRGKLEGPSILGAVTKSLAEWGSCHFCWSLTQERLFLLSPLAFLLFLLHCIPT